jgi:hypothetical protein
VDLNGDEGGRIAAHDSLISNSLDWIAYGVQREERQLILVAFPAGWAPAAIMSAAYSFWADNTKKKRFEFIEEKVNCSCIGVKKMSEKKRRLWGVIAVASTLSLASAIRYHESRNVALLLSSILAGSVAPYYIFQLLRKEA